MGHCCLLLNEIKVSLKTVMDYFSTKSLSKYLMNNIEFNKHDVDIFINGTWQKYAGNIGRLFKITRLLELRF
jgi:hypothetical protein